jgi:hypothetical protein
MTMFFGIAALVALFAGFTSFGWIVHASLNHRLRIFGWSFDEDQRSKPFHRTLFAMGVFGIVALAAAFMAFVAMLDASGGIEL